MTLANQEGGPADGKWHVGTGTRRITPEEPILLSGYASRLERSSGVDADLFARSVALRDERDRTVVIVSLDLLGVSNRLRETVADRCKREFGLSWEEVLLNASHTHHGPEYRSDEWGLLDAGNGHDDLARTYRQRLVEQIVEAVGEALADRVPATVRYSFGRAGFGVNRRRPTPDGFALAAYPEGLVDTEVPTLVARRGDTVQAILFGYACHPTSLPPQQTTFHPDWPGIAATELETQYPDSTAVFLQGCGADQNPYPRCRTDATEHHGRTIALAVEAAIEAEGRRVDGPLRTASETLQLRFAEQPDRDDLERRVDTDGTDQYARRCLRELEERGEIRREFPLHFGGVGFGTDLTLLTVGGEVPVSIATQLKERLVGDIWVAGYTDQGYLYVPTSRMLEEGGYESTWVSQYWGYPAPLERDSADRVVPTALALAQRLGSTRKGFDFE
jgi:hypothetical protein